MRNIMLIAVALLSTSVFGQSVTTGRILNTTNGSKVNATVVNSGSTVAVVMNGGNMTSANCVPMPILNQPHVQESLGGETYVNNSSSQWAYPNNVNITTLTFRFCYTVSGYVYGDMSVFPILRHKVTGTYYEGPAAFTVAGPGIFYSRYYSVTSTTPASNSGVVNWNVNSYGIQSMDLANYEFGFIIYSPTTPWLIPVSDAIKIFGMEVKASFIRTTQSGQPPTPSLTYNAAPAIWSSRSVTLTQPMPAPSSALGVRTSVKCSDNSYYTVENLYWGANPPSPVVRTYTMGSLNGSACAGKAITQGSTVNFRQQLLTSGGGITGSLVFSNTITAN